MSEAKKPNNLSAALDACIKAFADAPDSDFEMGTPLEGTVEHPVAAISTPVYADPVYLDGLLRRVKLAYFEREWKAVERLFEAEITEMHMRRDDLLAKRTLSLAGCVKDATAPCGWRNKRAEEAEAVLIAFNAAYKTGDPALVDVLHMAERVLATMAEAKFTDQMDQLNQLKKYAYSGYEDDGDSDFKYGYNTALRGLRRMLNLEQPAESSSTPQDAAKWKSMESYPPPVGEECLVAYERCVEAATFDGERKEWCLARTDSYNDPLYVCAELWQPLPAPPLNLEQPKGDS